LAAWDKVEIERRFFSSGLAAVLAVRFERSIPLSLSLSFARWRPDVGSRRRGRSLLPTVAEKPRAKGVAQHHQFAINPPNAAPSR
jgi:hypothetical protein